MGQQHRVPGATRFQRRDVMLSSALALSACVLKANYDLTFSQNINTHTHNLLQKTRHTLLVIWLRLCLPKLTRYVIYCRMICTDKHEKGRQKDRHTHTLSPERVWTLNSWGLVVMGIGVSSDPCDARRLQKYASLERLGLSLDFKSYLVGQRKLNKDGMCVSAVDSINFHVCKINSTTCWKESFNMRIWCNCPAGKLQRQLHRNLARMLQERKFFFSFYNLKFVVDCLIRFLSLFTYSQISDISWSKNRKLL